MTLPHSKKTAYLLLFINSLIWGISPAIVKNSLNYFSADLFLFLRFVIATILYTPFILLYLKENPHKKFNIGQILPLALLGVPLTLLPLFYGLELVSSFQASILEATSPLFTILGSAILLNEKIRRRERLGLAITILGTLIFTVANEKTGGGISLLGFGLIIFSNLIWSLFLIRSKTFKQNPIIVSYVSFVISVPFFLVSILLKNSHELNSLPSALFSPGIYGVLYMAVFGSIVAFWAYQEAQKYINPGEGSIFSYLKPVFTLPLSLFWLSEKIGPFTILGCIIIILGVFIAESKKIILFKSSQKGK